MQTLYQKLLASIGPRTPIYLVTLLLCLVGALYFLLQTQLQTQQQLQQRNQKTLLAMRTLVQQHALPVALLLVKDPVPAIMQHARQAGVTLSESHIDKQQVSFRVAAISLGRFINWTQQLNAATGVKVEKVIFRPLSGENVQVDATLGWRRQQ